MKLVTTFLVILVSHNLLAAGDYSPLGFKRMASANLNSKLETALKSIGCRVTSSSGVTGVSDDHHRRNPSSCHEVGKAIDIATLACANGKSNSENLMALFNKLGGLTYLTCYRGRGRCTSPHTSHLHFGAAEWTGCAG